MGRKRIIVVDDDDCFSSILRLNLENMENYEVLTVNNPCNALLAAHRFNPDLILLDIVMPYLDGPDVYNALKNDEILCDIPVIFLTATITEKEIEMYNGNVGGHLFVSKPSCFSILVDVIEQTIGSNIKFT